MAAVEATNITETDRATLRMAHPLTAEQAARIGLPQAVEPGTEVTLRKEYAGIILSLAKQEQPDTSAYVDDEIIYRVKKRHHAGLIVCSTSPDIIQTRLDDYARRFMEDFYASAPAPDKATH